jgi:hypothetical protein
MDQSPAPGGSEFQRSKPREQRVTFPFVVSVAFCSNWLVMGAIRFIHSSIHAKCGADLCQVFLIIRPLRCRSESIPAGGSSGRPVGKETENGRSRNLPPQVCNMPLVVWRTHPLFLHPQESCPPTRPELLPPLRESVIGTRLMLPLLPVPPEGRSVPHNRRNWKDRHHRARAPGPAQEQNEPFPCLHGITAYVPAMYSLCAGYMLSCGSEPHESI